MTAFAIRPDCRCGDNGQRLARRRDLAVGTSAFACLGAAFAASPDAVSDGPIVCPFRLATGLPCPGCGLARSWVAFAHGDVDSAIAFNVFGPLLFVLAVCAVAAVGYSFVRRRSPVDLAAAAGSTPAVALAVAWLSWWLSGFAV